MGIFDFFSSDNQKKKKPVKVVKKKKRTTINTAVKKTVKPVKPVKKEEEKPKAMKEKVIVEHDKEDENKEKETEMELLDINFDSLMGESKKKEEKLEEKLEKLEEKTEKPEEESEDTGGVKEVDFEEGQRLKKVYITDGSVSIFDNPKEIERKLFGKFLEKIEARIGKSGLAIASSYQSENNVHLIEALIETNQLKPIEIFNILKEIVEEEDIGNVFFIKDYKLIEIDRKDLDDEKIIFKYENKRIEPRFHLSSLFSIPQDAVLAILPYDEWKKLKLAVTVAKSGELKFTFEQLLRDAIDKGASDIHIVNKEEGFYVFFRIKKQFVLQEQYFMNKQEWLAFVNVLSKMAADENAGYFDPDNRRINQEARITFPEQGCSVRYEFIPDGSSLKYGEIVCRILKKESISGREPLETRLTRLGYDAQAINVLKAVSQMEGGMAVISGKTNSGKSTLIAQILASIPETRKVGTIEDPIEYSYANKNIVQHQLYLPEKGKKMDFTQYVKAFKRADYDVVLVGEWRRAEGLTEAMVEQAEAGQLIFTTLHIASAYDIYISLYNIFRVPFDVSANLIVLSFNQTLAPVVCPYCSDEVEITFTESEIAPLKTLTDDDKIELLRTKEIGRQVNLEKAKNCPHCNGIGYLGFVPIYEYFVPNEEIRRLVVEKGTRLSPVSLRSFVSELTLGGVSYVKRGLATFKKEVALQRLKEGKIDKETFLKML